MQSLLYIVPTPIGNLEDMTPRALRVLEDVPLIAAEDTRRTRQLMAHFGISTAGKRIFAHHKDNEWQSAEGIINFLKEGQSVALVSDSGMPTISDPGSRLVERAIEEGFTIVPLAGASAAAMALAASGLGGGLFTFVGFLPHKKKKMNALLADVAPRTDTLIFYEAPHRILATLKVLIEALGDDRPACLARELTKMHEEFVRGTLTKIHENMAARDSIKGEITLVVAGKTQAAT